MSNYVKLENTKLGNIILKYTSVGLYQLLLLVQ